MCKSIFCILLLATAVIAIDVQSNAQRDLAEPGQFPYLVEFYMWVESMNKTLPCPCNGVIISPNYLLTTAYCTWRYGVMEFVAGCVDYESPDCVKYKIKHNDIIRHPDWGFYGYNDIAIVPTETPIEMSSLVQSIPISEDLYADGTTFTIAHWNQNGMIHSEQLIVNKDECDASYDQYPEIFDTLLCSEANSTNFGSPMLFDGKLVALSEFFMFSNDFYFYIRPGAYVDWINSVIME